MVPTRTLTANDRCRCLELLKSDIQTFGPDQIKLIKKYLPETGIRTNIISLFETLRSQLTRDTPIEISQRYKELKNKFIMHLDHRIHLLQDPKQGQDPWIVQSLKEKDSANIEKLQEMSRHIRDVLFTCDLIVNYELNEGVALTTAELHELTGLLTPDETMVRYLIELESTIRKKDFETAKKLLKDFQKKLSIEIIAFKHIYSVNPDQKLSAENSIKQVAQKRWS